MTTLSFLVDVQLPKTLARWITEQGAEAVHVHDVGLGRATDREICELAQSQGRIIVTKDADFLDLSLRFDPAIRLVWVRMGNVSTNALLDRFSTAWLQIKAALLTGETVVELL
ncbi:hypothetical protein X907_2658 [Glycocaulis alkaliphilus]|uniref:Uncharacterized protein n=1 Tax=Glycocaulis alkaliphilus TaxID=1434191 RepID=A0A3T0ECY8_9PROT|nr:DUF5615 family PIN-like protein [Glycocaulis alkaliphilus]AZU05169.1 hypothetical protein X907_2658 [Glycocaulis alkaliphilus]GGB64684.1 hypothetical protein GCM10007417_00500 [Glycocaulis alkaliphilus]